VALRIHFPEKLPKAKQRACVGSTVGFRQGKLKKKEQNIPFDKLGTYDYQRSIS
jgi:hypothetical protein